MEQIIRPIVLSMKFVINQFKEIIRLGVALSIVAAFLFALSFPFTLIDNYFSSNSTYKIITANLSEFTSKLYKTLGCAILPSVCISVEELSEKLKQENIIFDSLNTEKKSALNNTVIQHDK